VGPLAQSLFSARVPIAQGPHSFWFSMPCPIRQIHDASDIGTTHRQRCRDQFSLLPICKLDTSPSPISLMWCICIARQRHSIINICLARRSQAVLRAFWRDRRVMHPASESIRPRVVNARFEKLPPMLPVGKNYTQLIDCAPRCVNGCKADVRIDALGG
jgi:hypothetical protein